MKVTYVEKAEPTPTDTRLFFLMTKLGYEIDELVKQKGAEELGNDERMILLSKQDLNNIYFAMKEELERRKEYYFGGGNNNEEV